MADISNKYTKIPIKTFEEMKKNRNKDENRVFINKTDFVTNLKFEDMDTRVQKFVKDNKKNPETVKINWGDDKLIRTYKESVLASKAIDIINETKKRGKNPDQIHIRNMQNNNLDVLSKTQYMGLYEQRMLYRLTNGKYPNYTTLRATANNPVIWKAQSNAYNCGPMSMSMASQMLFKYTPESEFVKTCLTNKNGTDPKNLTLISKLGFSIKSIGRNSKAVKEALARGSAVIAHIQTKPANCLGYLNDYGHYVLIDRMSDTQYHVCDPTKGVKWCNFNVLENATNGRDIKFYEMKVA